MRFDTFSARSLQLANHMVMAPMTRRRAAPEHTPDAWMATDDSQRATAGLGITEGTSPSPNGLGDLIEQVLNPLVNICTDAYGGRIEGRSRFALDIASATVSATGRNRVGIRRSLHGVFNGTGECPEVQAQYLALAKSLSALGVLCIQPVEHSSLGAPPVPADLKRMLRAGFDGLFILPGGFDHASAEQALLDKRGDLIAFGRPVLANPGLVAQMRKDAPMNAPDMTTFDIPGAKGDTDYPALTA